MKNRIFELKTASKKTDMLSSAKRSKAKLTWLFTIFLVLALISVGCSSSDSSKDVEPKKDYLQNEVAVFEDVNYSLIKVEKTQGTNKYSKPDKGYEYVKITVRIENKSKEKVSFNVFDWKMVNADGVEDDFGTFTLDDDILLSSGDLEPNGKVEGVLIWEQKIGDANLRLRYYGNMFDEDYTFQFKLD